MALSGDTVRRQEMKCLASDIQMYPGKVLLPGEILLVDMEDGTWNIKIGDGSAGVGSLPYAFRFREEVPEMTLLAEGPFTQAGSDDIELDEPYMDYDALFFECELSSYTFGGVVESWRLAHLFEHAETSRVLINLGGSSYYWSFTAAGSTDTLFKFGSGTSGVIIKNVYGLKY